jgi:ubiquinone/menaquinone biosynthesis C-methylase UbiE
LALYEGRILPWLIDRGMSQRRLLPLRETLVGAATGRVLEIGIGSGLNLPFYPRNIDQLWGIDPSRPLLTMAKRHTAWVHFEVRLAEGRAEDLPIDDDDIDTVVVTWSLCSVTDPAKALAEVRRVLRPGGSLLFIEHGRSPEAGLGRWQTRLTPFWRRCAGNCHLDRPIADLIRAAGLRLTDLETGHLIAGPRLLTYHYRGRAVV